MASEEIKKIVQQFLNEKLESLTERINSIEKELLNLKTRLYSTEKESNFQNITLNDKLSLIEVKFQSFLDAIENTQSQAKQILDQTDKRLKEMEKLKQNQQVSLENQFMCKLKAEENSGLVRNQLQQQQPFSEKQQLLPIQFTPQNSQISQSQGNQQGVYKTSTGKKYHKAGCEWLKNSEIPIAQQQAIREGLTACFVCKP